VAELICVFEFVGSAFVVSCVSLVSVMKALVWSCVTVLLVSILPISSEAVLVSANDGLI